MKPGATLYIEDYGRHREATLEEAEALAAKVQCPFVPSIDEYRHHLADAGFGHVELDDVTQQWTAFTSTRLASYREARQRNIAVHGATVVEGLEDFYATVASLFQGGLIAGLKITAS